MSPIRRSDHVGITVADLYAVTGIRLRAGRSSRGSSWWNLKRLNQAARARPSGQGPKMPRSCLARQVPDVPARAPQRNRQLPTAYRRRRDAPAAFAPSAPSPRPPISLVTSPSDHGVASGLAHNSIHAVY
jgi:hypothetical protein